MTDAGSRNLAAAGEGFRVGRVLSQSFTLLLRHFGKFILLGLIAALPMLFLLLFNRPPPGQQIHMDLGWSLVLVGLLTLLLQVICEAAVIFGAFQAMRGREFSIGDSVSRGLQRFLPVLGTGICLVIAVAVGFILFIVPGFIFLTMFMVAIPACVVEGLGPIRSLGRSRELTSGHRWRLLGLYVALILLIAIVRVPIEMIFGAIGGTALAGIVGFLYTAATTAFQLLTFVVAYHDLRVVKEGVDIEHMASVFD